MKEIEKRKMYKDSKENLYQVLDIVHDSQNSDKIVIYRALYGEHLTFAKPYSLFADEFEEYKPNYEKEGLKAFLALKFYDGDVSKKLVDDITESLAKLNIHTFVAVRDIEKYGEVKGLDMEHFMPKYTFPEMETSNIMIIEYSESGAGLRNVC